MLQFTRLSFSKKLFLLLSLTLVGMAFFGFIYINQEWQILQKNKQTLSVAQEIRTIGAVVHELQKERGRSAGFVGGVSDESLLYHQRILTNNALQTLANTKKELFTLTELEQIRHDVDQKKYSLLRVSQIYSAFIDSYLTYMNKLDTEINYAKQVQKDDYMHLAYTKELYGQTRALLSGVFAKNSITQEEIFATVGLKAHLDGEEKNFLLNASPTTKTMYAQKVTGSHAHQAVRVMMNKIYGENKRENFGISPLVWFETITEVINAERHIEVVILDNIVTNAEEGYEKALWSFFSALVMILSLFVLSLGLAFYVIRSVTQTLNTVTRGLDAFFDFLSQRADKPVAIEIHSHDQFGEMAHNINKHISAIEALFFEKALYENKLRENEERFNTLVQNANGAIVSTDKKGIIRLWNQDAQKIFGYSAEEIVGKNVTLLMPEAFRSLHTQGMERMNTTKTAHVIGKTVELIGERKGGEQFPLELSLSTWMWNNEPYYAAIIRDITERKEVQRALESLNTTLEEKIHEESGKRVEQERLMMQQSRLAMMGEMIGNIAHQWRQPLNALGLLIQDIKDSYEYNELTPEYMDEIIDTSMGKISFMSQTIDDFRNFFKSDKVKSTFFVHKEIIDTLTLLHGILEQNSIRVNVNIPIEVSVLGYQGEFKQALLNIINNAKDALVERKRDNPTITINLSLCDYVIFVTISDNAGGIPDDILERIFEPYFTTKHKAQGTGIGLYMTKTIIESHFNGKLSATNTEEGAMFTIQLPMDFS